MDPLKPTVFSRCTEAAYEFFAVFCMLFSASALVSLSLVPDWSPWFFLFFLAVFGLIHTAGKCLGQQRISGTVLWASLALSLIFFRKYPSAGEILLAFGGYFFALFLHGRNRLRQTAVALETAGLILCGLSGLPVSRLLAAAVLFLVLKEAAGLISSHPDFPDCRELGLRLTPYFLAMELVILLLPFPDHPFDWSFVVNWGHRAADAISDAALEFEYIFDNSGITARWGSGDGNLELLGHTFGESREELYLSSKSTYKSLYLTGSHYSAFDGNRWEQDREISDYDDWYPLYLRALYEQRITPEEAACFSRICTTEITYGSLKTRSFFHPALLLQVDKAQMEDLAEDGRELRFRSGKGRGYRYRIQFMDLDFASPYLVPVLQKAGDLSPDSWPSYQELDEYSQKLYRIPLARVIPEDRYESYILTLSIWDSAPYLSLEGSTPAMQKLADTITEHCTDDFQRCRAIEAYLRQYAYSKEADYGNYVNFADAFLFEEQAGYCVHFASAMVMLLRCAGVPARLAEGYSCHYEDPLPNGGYVITGDYAHTWPEAYLDGFGWIRLEPTVIMTGSADDGWGLTVAEPSGESEESSGLLPGSADEEPEQEIPPLTEVSESEEKGRVWIMALGFLAVILILYLFLFLVMQPQIRRILYRRKSGLDRITADLEDICFLIRSVWPAPPGPETALSGQAGWQNQPLLSYGEAIGDPELKEQMNRLCLIYYRMKYGKKETAPEFQALAVEIRSRLRQIYISREKKGVWKRRLTVYLKTRDDGRAPERSRGDSCQR